MDVQDEIRNLLKADGGWLSRNAMLNRIDGAQEKALTLHLGHMVKARELLRINGVNGFEYALPGTAEPKAAGGSAVRQLQPADVAPETLRAKPKGAASPLETIPTRAAAQPAVIPPVAAGYNQGQYLSAKEKARAPAIEPPKAAPIAEPKSRAPRAPVGATVQQIREYLAKHPTASGRQVAQAVGLTEATVHYHLKRIAADAAPAEPKQPQAAAPLVSAAGPAQYALWSTGEFVIRRGDDRLVLSVDDTRQLVAYLDRVLLPQEADAA